MGVYFRRKKGRLLKTKLFIFVALVAVTMMAKSTEPINCTLQGAVGRKMDALLNERVYSPLAQGRIFNEAVNAFRTKWDDTANPGSGNWQGEYWGKTMLGYTGAWRYTEDARLKEFIERKSLELIREFQEEDGYIGTYSNKYFIGAVKPAKPWSVWTCNLWNRKYTIWALTEAAQITGNKEILSAAEKAMNHWIESLRHEGMTVRESGAFSGFMSMSILKPLLVLWRETNNVKFRKFADELVNEWRLPGPREETLPNLLVNAFSECEIHKWAPNSKVWAKAYETMSCLEGLVEYWRITNDEQVLKAVQCMVAKLEKEEMNAMWSVGHFDHFTHSAALQSGGSEPCDVVHWLRVNRELFLTTGNPHYLDLMEKAFYNAFLAGTFRDGKWVAHMVRSHGSRHLSAPPQTGMLYHQCCVDNQPRGFYTFAETALTRAPDGTACLNFFSDLSAALGPLKVATQGNYPISDTITLFTNTVEPCRLRLRIPDTAAALTINGKRFDRSANPWAEIELRSEQTWVVKFDFLIQVIDAPFAADYNRDNVYERDVLGWSKSVFTMAARNPEMVGLWRTEPVARLMRGPLVLAKARAVGATREETFNFKSIDRQDYKCELAPLNPTSTWGAWRATFRKDGVAFTVNVCDYSSAADYDDPSNFFSVFF